jgi:hypothetical protein
MMDNESKILKQYARLLRSYVEMRQQMVDLLRMLDEEEITRENNVQRTAADLLDMAFDYVDEARERLEPVDKLLMTAQPLFFGHSQLIAGATGDTLDLDDLHDLLDGLNLDLD